MPTDQGNKATIGDTLALYRDAPLAVRMFLRGRVLLSDLEFVERQVPRTGAVLDLGCGHGLFANLMALGSPSRQVTGIDLSPAKIQIAETTTGARPNIRFLVGDMLKLDLPECDIVTIVDVLYLLPRDRQQELLSACRSLLKPGGKLIWKTQETRPKWKYYWTYFQEFVTTSIGLTQGRHSRLCFLSREESLAALSEAGFTPRLVEMHTRRPYTDVIFVAE